uniref:Uncharacterized protein n=1 Tax=Cacopsylla melanoneura TaxID=428564 RepID=A0A8D8UI08_9HEMI
MLCLKSHNLRTEQWEQVLDNSLHSIRSLLCAVQTNSTPHERMFNHSRRSFNGTSLPTWLTNSGPVFMRVSNRRSKYDPLVEEVELLEANHDYAHVRLTDGRETTVSIRNLAPIGSDSQRPEENEHANYPESCEPELPTSLDSDPVLETETDNSVATPQPLELSSIV